MYERRDRLRRGVEILPIIPTSEQLALGSVAGGSINSHLKDLASNYLFFYQISGLFFAKITVKDHECRKRKIGVQ